MPILFDTASRVVQSVILNVMRLFWYRTFSVSAPLRVAVSSGMSWMRWTVRSIDGVPAAPGNLTLGTIENTGPMPRAWLARFGRTVAEQVIDAVEGRFSAERTPGVEMRLAGQALGGASAEEREALEESEAEKRLEAMTSWLRGAQEDGEHGWPFACVPVRPAPGGAGWPLARWEVTSRKPGAAGVSTRIRPAGRSTPNPPG